MTWRQRHAKQKRWNSPIPISWLEKETTRWGTLKCWQIFQQNFRYVFIRVQSTCENSYDYLLAKRKRARERDEDDTEDPEWTDGHIVNDDDDEVETEEDTDTEEDSGHQSSSQSDSADCDDKPSDPRRSTRINPSACLCTLHKCTESGNTLLLGCVTRPCVWMRIKKNLFAGFIHTNPTKEVVSLLQ